MRGLEQAGSHLLRQPTPLHPRRLQQLTRLNQPAGRGLDVLSRLRGAERLHQPALPLGVLGRLREAVVRLRGVLVRLRGVIVRVWGLLRKQI